MADFDSLLDELRAIRADKQQIPSYDVADTAVLVDGIETLISRVADLEASHIYPPDVIDDGVEVWLVQVGLDVSRDATSSIHAPTYRIGGRDFPEPTLICLRNSLMAALQMGDES